MANFSKSGVSYQPFRADPVLADGLIAIQRPGGEVERALADSLFGAARKFGQDAEQEAARRGAKFGREQQAGQLPAIDVTGGDVTGVTGASDPAAPGTRHVGGAGSGAGNFTAEAAPAGSVGAIIASAAARHGVPVAAMMKVAQIESGMNPHARNPNSSAGGLFQQTDGNAAQYGITNRFDPVQSADGAARFMRDNYNYLSRKLGRPPTAGELYLAHQQGPGGAARLLLNPGAPAAAVVGHEAVRLNGGNGQMTAGEFAAKWTARADGARPVPIGPGAMTQQLPDVQVVRAPLSIDVTPTTLMQSGRNTIFGRAYDEAAAATYKSALNDEMLSAVDRIEQVHGDDPAEMRYALEQLRQKQLAADVPQAIRADYEIGFHAMEREALRKAQGRADKKREAEGLAQFQQRSTDLGNKLNQAIVGLDPANPDSFTRVQAEAARVKRQYSEAVARGYMTEGEAQKAAAGVESDVAVGWYAGQAAGKTATEIDALRETYRQDYAAGKMPGLDAAGYHALSQQLTATASKTRQTERKTSLGRKADLHGLIKDDVASVKATGQGLNLKPDEVFSVLGETEGRKWLEQRDAAEKAFRAVDGMDAMTPDDMEKRLAELEPKAGQPGFAEAKAAHDAAVKASKAILVKRNADPASAAEDAFPDIAKEENPLNKAIKRMNAQSALGIEEMAQQPLTKAEARNYSDRLSMFQGPMDGDKLNAEMGRMFQEIQSRYGGMADEVAAQVLRQKGLSRETSKLAAALIGQLHLGDMQDDGAFHRQLGAGWVTLNADAADQAMNGSSSGGGWGGLGILGLGPLAQWQIRGDMKRAKDAAKLPNAAQIEKLRSQPDLAPQFDAKFGQGAAQQWINSGQGDGATRRLPDGSTEIIYEDGWIETMHPDGTIDGRMGP